MSTGRRRLDGFGIEDGLGMNGVMGYVLVLEEFLLYAYIISGGDLC